MEGGAKVLCRPRPVLRPWPNPIGIRHAATMRQAQGPKNPTGTRFSSAPPDTTYVVPDDGERVLITA